MTHKESTSKSAFDDAVTAIDSARQILASISLDNLRTGASVPMLVQVSMQLEAAMLVFRPTRAR